MAKTVRWIHVCDTPCGECGTWWTDYQDAVGTYSSPYAPLAAYIGTWFDSHGGAYDILNAYRIHSTHALESPSGNAWDQTLGTVISEILGSAMYASMSTYGICEPQFIIECKGHTEAAFAPYSAGPGGTGPNFATIAQMQALDLIGTDDDAAQWRWGYKCPYVRSP